MTFLCFLGALPASLVAHYVHPMVLLKVYGIGLNMMKYMLEPRDITCYCNTQFTKETNCSHGDD